MSAITGNNKMAAKNNHVKQCQQICLSFNTVRYLEHWPLPEITKLTDMIAPLKMQTYIKNYTFVLSFNFKI